MFLDAVTRDYNYAPSAVMVAAPTLWLRELVAIAKAAQSITERIVSKDLISLWKDVEPEVAHQITAEYLVKSSSAIILLGNLAQSHPRFAELRALAGIIADLTGASLGYLPEGAGTVGAWLAGCVPHRGPGGNLVEVGQNWHNMVTGGVKGLLILGAELDHDCANSDAAVKGLRNTDFVVSLSPWNSRAQEDYADAILPVTPYAETSGTYVNLEGRWQGFQGAATPLGEARPGWKVLRVLGNLLDLKGFDYFSSEQVLSEVKELIGIITPNNFMPWRIPQEIKSSQKGLTRFGEVPPYAGDALVRRANVLQATPDGQIGVAARINATTATHLGLADFIMVTVHQGESKADLPLVMDNRVAEGCVSVPSAVLETATLGENFGDVKLIAVTATPDRIII
ncbi:hypothetical protein CCP3SC5AM1_50020 [Gammaproteobacteria bacterium]